MSAVDNAISDEHLTWKLLKSTNIYFFNGPANLRSFKHMPHALTINYTSGRPGYLRDGKSCTLYTAQRFELPVPSFVPEE